MEPCELCHGDVGIEVRAGRKLCTECVDAWDYRASLTSDELRAEDEAMARYVDEQRGQP